MSEHFKYFMDGISLAAVAGALTAVLPPLAAFLGIVWYGMQMYDWIQEKKQKKDK